MPENKDLNLEEQLLANAVAPKSVDIDGQKVEQHSIDDQIKAIQFAASMKAAKSRNIGIRFAKMNHGGTND